MALSVNIDLYCLCSEVVFNLKTYSYREFENDDDFDSFRNKFAKGCLQFSQRVANFTQK